MRKLLSSLGLLSVMVLCSAGAFAADEDSKPKKGKFGDKFKAKPSKIDTDKLFEKLDANNDGKISKEEFKKVFENLGKGKFADKLGDKLDGLADRTFDRLDADSDGYLSKEEFKKFGGFGDLGGGGFGKGDFKDKLKGFKDKFEGFKDKFGKKGEKKEEKKEEKKDQ